MVHAAHCEVCASLMCLSRQGTLLETCRLGVVGHCLPNPGVMVTHIDSAVALAQQLCWPACICAASECSLSGGVLDCSCLSRGVYLFSCCGCLSQVGPCSAVVVCCMACFALLHCHTSDLETAKCVAVWHTKHDVHVCLLKCCSCRRAYMHLQWASRVLLVQRGALPGAAPTCPPWI